MIANSYSALAGANALAFSLRELPEEAYERARQAIIDTIGVTIAGSVHEGCRILCDTVLQPSGDGEIVVIGSGRRAGIFDAALINGTASHMLDYDDFNSSMFGHLSVAILPALLALAEHKNSSGAQVLHAFICGYEAGNRFGRTISKFQYTHGWHPTTTVGIFASVIANAILLGQNEQQIAMAIGIAAHHASGLKSNFGSMTKPLGVGNASRNALTASLLAGNGFTSGQRSLEHHHGVFSVFNNGIEHCDPQPLIEPWVGDLGILNCLKGIKQKRYPCCYATAPPLDGLLKLRQEHSLEAEQIEEIVIGIHAIRFPHINVPEPEDALAAKFSMTYCAARAILAGEVVMSDFDQGAAFSDAKTHEFMKKVRLVIYNRDNFSGAEVSVKLKGGRELNCYVEAALGSTYDNPMTPDMIREKFLTCVAPVLGETEFKRFIAICLSLKRAATSARS